MKHAFKNTVELENFLRSRDLRVTPARVAVISYLTKQTKPIPIENLQKGIGKLGIGIDQSTIYRSVGTLTKEGIVREIRISKEKVFIEMAESDHHHIVCNLCGLIEETNGCITDGIEEKTLKHSKKFKKIQSHSLEFFGVCTVCSKKS